MAKLIGTAPNQVPTNGDLGSMAFEDRNNYVTKTNPIYQPYRNLIINGDMSIAQRGTSQANAGLSGGAYQVIDRFKLYNNSLGQFTVSQSTDVPTGQGFGYSTKWDCTTADASPSANDYAIHSQTIEGQMLQQLKKGTSNAESVALSFWVKSNKTGTYVVELFDLDNSRQISKSYTIDSASTWEKKTITYEGDTTGTINNDNGSSLHVHIWLGVGSNYNSGTFQSNWESTLNANRVSSSQVNLADNTANEFYITGVQLEVGTSASDFEFLPYDVNLTRCMRYFERISRDGNRAYAPIANGMQRLTTQSYGNVLCRVLKRASSTSISINNIILTDRKTQDKPATAIGNISTDYQGVHMDFTHDAFGADFRPVLICGHNSTGGYIDIDSEL